MKTPALLEGELHFMARTAAGASHELRKLLEHMEHVTADMAVDCKDCSEGERRVIADLQDSAARGRAMAMNLNSFMRSFAAESLATNAAEAMHLLTSFGKRAADCRGVSLQWEPLKKAVTVAGLPFPLLHLLSASLEYVVDAAHMGQTVQLSVELEDAMASFSFSWTGNPLPASFPDAITRELADDMGADLRTDGTMLQVWLPAVA